MQADPEAANIARLLRDLVLRLRNRWVPATRLPTRLVHGDVRLGNINRGESGETVYLDFGFLARRQRIHELGYSLAWMVLALGGHRDPEHFEWTIVPRLLAEYEAAADTPLMELERTALPAYAAAVPLYQAATCGFLNDPARELRDDMGLPFMRLSEWLLAHPEVVSG